MELDVLRKAVDDGGSHARFDQARLQRLHGGYVLVLLHHVGHHVAAHVPGAAHGDQHGQAGQEPGVEQGLDHLGEAVFRIVGPVLGGAHGGGVPQVQPHRLCRTEDSQVEARIGPGKVGAHGVPGLQPGFREITDAQGGKVRQLGRALLLQTRGGSHNGGKIATQKPDAQGILRRKGHTPPGLLCPDEVRRPLMEPGRRFHPVRIGKAAVLPRRKDGSPAQQEGQRQAGPGHEATLPAHSMPTHSKHRAQRAVTAAREMPVFTNPCRCRSRTRRAGTR